MIDYNYQANANISGFLEDVEYEERKNALLEIVDAFNGIGYGIICSFNLFLRGIVDDFHDFDLLVDIKDIHKVKNIMEIMGAELIETGGNGYCESDQYLHYQLGRVDVDIIAGFRVVTFNTEILYKFNSDEISTYTIYEEKELKIPIVPTEAMYLLYAMMEGWQAKRRYKRLLMAEYLQSQKLDFPEILRNYLEKPLPGWVKREIRRLLITAI